jgi:hypothetical protein
MNKLQKDNFSRFSLGIEKGRNSNCVPSIFAAFLGLDTTESEKACIGYPARTGRKFGGTKITWSNPAEQFRQSYGIDCTNTVDGTNLLRWNQRANGTLAQAVKNLEEGAYVCIHKGHAFGVLVVAGKAYTVDYGKGNGARRIVWTLTKLDNVDAAALLARLQGKSEAKAEKKVEKRTYTLSLDGGALEAALRTVNVRTEDGKWHSLKTAQDSREFCREFGNDSTIPAARWEAIFNLQF